MTEYLKMVPLPSWWQKLDLNEFKVYSIGRTWSWPVMSAPACFDFELRKNLSEFYNGPIRSNLKAMIYYRIQVLLYKSDSALEIPFGMWAS